MRAAPRGGRGRGAGRRGIRVHPRRQHDALFLDNLGGPSVLVRRRHVLSAHPVRGPATRSGGSHRLPFDVVPLPPAGFRPRRIRWPSISLGGARGMAGAATGACDPAPGPRARGRRRCFRAARGQRSGSRTPSPGAAFTATRDPRTRTTCSCCGARAARRCCAARQLPAGPRRPASVEAARRHPAHQDADVSGAGLCGGRSGAAAALHAVSAAGRRLLRSAPHPLRSARLPGVPAAVGPSPPGAGAPRPSRLGVGVPTRAALSRR